MEFSAFTGLRSDRPVERFSPSDLSVADNINIDNSGALALRSGTTLVSAGAKHSAWSDDLQTIGLYVSGTTLYSMGTDINLTPTAIATGLTSGSRMSYYRRDERVYYSNGHECGIIENHTSRSWGLAVPTLPGIALTVGAMLTGGYQYTMTYVRSDGQESGARMPAGRFDVALDGAGFQFVLPVSSDPTVVAKNIYISTRNGEVLYLAGSVPNAQTSWTYQNDTSELNLPLITQFLSGAPAGQLLGFFRGRAYVAVNDMLYPSEEYAYEWFDLRKGIPFDGRITLFAALEDTREPGVFIGTDRSCGVMMGRGPGEFTYTPKVSYGAIEGSMVMVDGSLYADDSARARMLPMWLTPYGICSGVPGMEIRNLTRTTYSFPVGGRGAGLFIPGPNRLILSSVF